jgi:hypothetical protein
LAHARENGKRLDRPHLGSPGSRRHPDSGKMKMNGAATPSAALDGH